MFKKDIDLKCQVFGRLQVLDKEPVKRKENGRIRVYWWCRCSCKDKTEKLVRANDLMRPDSRGTKSCGCLARERASKSNKKTNKIVTKDDYCVGYTSKNERFYFDIEDLDKLKEKYWFIDKHAGGYVYYWDNSKQGKVQMHRVLMNPQDDEIIDHINRNPIDNRKKNLRICTHEINSKNISLHSDNVSGISDVVWMKDRKKWRARISDGDNGRLYLGDYESFNEAVDVRRKAEKELGYISANKVKHSAKEL